MRDLVREEIAQSVQKALAELGLNVPMQELNFVAPPSMEMGELALPAFPYARQLKKAPPQIAQELSQKIRGSHFQVEAVGPYVNFRLQAPWLADQLIPPIASGAFFQLQKEPGAQRTMIEYSQPNTHKEMHVGHMRNASLGLALTNIKKAAGYEVITSTFPGDVGTHVAKCLWYMKTQNREAVPSTGKGEWLGRMYSKSHLLLEDLESQGQADLAKQQLTEILKQLEKKQGEYFELWKETREWSLDLMKRTYDWLGIRFDHWYWESEMDSPSVAYVKKLFAEGKLVESQGAIGMNLEDANLGFCLLLKKDGTGLYATKDLELARRKFEDFHIEKSIYVVDLRQALHFKQVFMVLERLGFSQAKKCYHLAYNFVELPDGAMSSRKGNIVPITDLIEKMQDTLKAGHLQKYRDEWSPGEIEKVASQVANGAIKYGMLRMDTNKKIVFDMNEWLKTEGESGPFVQYSAARIQSLVQKFNFDPSGKVSHQPLNHPLEKALLQAMLFYEATVHQCAAQDRVTPLCTYLFDLAQRFNTFYHEVSVGKAETEELKLARLSLCSAVGQILNRGLGLLGIDVPHRM